MGRLACASALTASAGLQDSAVTSAQVGKGGLGPAMDETVPKTVRRKLGLRTVSPQRSKAIHIPPTQGKDQELYLFLGLSEEKKGPVRNQNINSVSLKTKPISR